MRRLLLVSLVLAAVAVAALAYQLTPRGGRNSALRDVAVGGAASNQVRVIPTRPREPDNAAQAALRGPSDAAESRPRDLLRDVSRTPGELRTRDEARNSIGPEISPAQIDALKAQAERRRVRPVTRMAFPIDPGTSVPPQVYLHPVPAEVAGLAPENDPLGFIRVGDKFVLVGTASRRIVAVARDERGGAF